MAMEFPTSDAQLVEIGRPSDDRTVSLGDMTTTWDKLGSDRRLKSDSDIAGFLLRYYEDTSQGNQSAACCVNCLTPLSLSCATCGSRPGMNGPQKKFKVSKDDIKPPPKHDMSDDDNNGVDLLDTDPASPSAQQVARTMVQLSFTTEEPPTPVISSDNVDNKDLHSCPHCGVKFAHMNGLTRHLSLEMCYTKPEIAEVIQQPIVPRLRPRNFAQAVPKQFRCTECGMKFVEADQLTTHMEIHSQEMPYKCSQCGAGFQKSSVLSLHMAKHEGRHICYHCGSEFVNAHGLTSHLKTEVCQAQAQGADASSQSLDEHSQLSQDSIIEKNTCKYCGKKFASPAHLKRHVLIHTGERPFACQECGSSFTQKTRLIDHTQREHLKDKPIKCGACARKFFTTQELTRHRCRPQANMDLDSEEVLQDGEGNSRPFKCQFCEAEFRFSNQLTAHLQTHTGEKEFKCPLCDKACADARYLKQHMRRHTQPKKKNSEERPFKCHLCSRAFKDKKMLTVHIRTHTGEKPFKCSHCEKAFAQRCNYRRHVLIHTGERPYKCNECEATFVHHTTYKGHLRTHTGARPYKCKFCEKTFRQSYSLTIHNRTHTNEKPYVCKLCSAAFAHPSSLSIHTRTHTGEKPYKCHHCEQCFSSASNRRAHMKKAHREFYDNGDPASSMASASNRKPRIRKPKQTQQLPPQHQQQQQQQQQIQHQQPPNERDMMMMPQDQNSCSQPQIPMMQTISVSEHHQVPQNAYRTDGIPVSVYGLWDGVRAPLQFPPPPPDAHSGPSLHMQAVWNDFRQPHDLSHARPHPHWN